VETVRAMAAISAEAERFEEVHLDSDFVNKTFRRIDQSIAMGALFTAYHLGCKAIVALTESGSTALWMSRQRVHVPIYALSPKVASLRKMALYRNVRPVQMDISHQRDEALAQAEQLLTARGLLVPGDTYAITCGEPMGAPGGTNMLKINRVA
jgi:pyruvate kinase